mgnify:CR=1 FL=1
MEEVHNQVHNYSNKFGLWKILEENFKIAHIFVMLTIELEYKFNSQKIATWALNISS